jgi:Leucine-rich repeat (LRR) protein
MTSVLHLFKDRSANDEKKYILVKEQQLHTINHNRTQNGGLTTTTGSLTSAATQPGTEQSTTTSKEQTKEKSRLWFPAFRSMYIQSSQYTRISHPPDLTNDISTTLVRHEIDNRSNDSSAEIAMGNSPFANEPKWFLCCCNEFEWKGDWFVVFSVSSPIDSSTVNRRLLNDLWWNSSADSMYGPQFVESTIAGEHGRCRFAPAVVCPNGNGEATSILAYSMRIRILSCRDNGMSRFHAAPVWNCAS